MALRAVVAEESPLLRQILSDLLMEDPAIRVVGYAKTAQDGVRLAVEHQADVLVVDANLIEIGSRGSIVSFGEQAGVPLLVLSTRAVPRAIASSQQPIAWLRKPQVGTLDGLGAMAKSFQKKIHVLCAA